MIDNSVHFFMNILLAQCYRELYIIACNSEVSNLLFYLIIQHLSCLKEARMRKQGEENTGEFLYSRALEELFGTSEHNKNIGKKYLYNAKRKRNGKTTRSERTGYKISGDKQPMQS